MCKLSRRNLSWTPSRCGEWLLIVSWSQAEACVELSIRMHVSGDIMPRRLIIVHCDSVTILQALVLRQTLCFSAGVFYESSIVGLNRPWSCATCLCHRICSCMDSSTLHELALPISGSFVVDHACCLCYVTICICSAGVNFAKAWNSFFGVRQKRRDIMQPLLIDVRRKMWISGSRILPQSFRGTFCIIMQPSLRRMEFAFLFHMFRLRQRQTIISVT